MIRQKWTEEQDAILISLVKSHSSNIQWDDITKQLRTFCIIKTIKQVRSRWYNNLLPRLNKEKWSNADLVRLFDAYSEHGCHWKRIAVEFGGRTDNNVKNHFFSMITKSLRFAFKNSDEKLDMSCTKLINQIKPKVLAVFLSKMLEFEDLTTKTVRKIKTIDFIKYICNQPELNLRLISW